MTNHLNKIEEDAEDPNLIKPPTMKDQLYAFLEVALSFADDDEKHLTFGEIQEHRELYYSHIQSLGYAPSDFKFPIFNVDRMPELLQQLKIDLIYACRKRVDTEFAMFAIEE